MQFFQPDHDQHFPSACGVCHFNCMWSSKGQEDRKELMKHFGWWNWDLMYQLHANDTIYRNFTYNRGGKKIPRLLAVNPKLSIKFKDELDMRMHFNDLLMLANILDRRLVWPYVSCDSSFFVQNPNHRLGIKTT